MQVVIGILIGFGLGVVLTAIFGRRIADGALKQVEADVAHLRAIITDFQSVLDARLAAMQKATLQAAAPGAPEKKTQG